MTIRKQIRYLLATALYKAANEAYHVANETLSDGVRKALKVVRPIEEERDEGGCWPKTTERLAAPKTLEELDARLRKYMLALERNAFDEMAEEVRRLLEGDDAEDETDSYGNKLVDPAAEARRSLGIRLGMGGGHEDVEWYTEDNLYQYMVKYVERDAAPLHDRIAELERKLAELIKLADSWENTMRNGGYIGPFGFPRQLHAALATFAPDHDAPSAPKYTWGWGQDCETKEWWLVEFRNGEPHRALHPLDGEKPAHRDTFGRWCVNNVPGDEVT